MYNFQNSAATQLKCGEMFSNRVIFNFLQNVLIKMFENRSLFGEDMDKNWRFTFLAHPACSAWISMTIIGLWYTNAIPAKMYYYYQNSYKEQSVHKVLQLDILNWKKLFKIERQTLFRQTLFRQTLFRQMLFRLKFTSTDASLHFTFTFTRGQQFHV